jgi:pyridoxine/pyridoxamine 5'-phosphate oxidase
MTLSTNDADGYPDARTLILKDLGSDQWSFATNSRNAERIQQKRCAGCARAKFFRRRQQQQV